jgi:hypothetical protein
MKHEVRELWLRFWQGVKLPMHKGLHINCGYADFLLILR